MAGFAGQRVLLIVTGGIAAYKCLELIRRGREGGLDFVCAMTEAAKSFVTPLSLAAISVNKVYDDLFSLTDEAEMGHIRLSRQADLVVVAPATADFMAKMAGGHADDLASTLVLATDKPVLLAPAMNPEMWGHPATVRNRALLEADGIHFVGPEPGEMACGETGAGRMSEPASILDTISSLLSGEKSLRGRRAIVTSGPTYEALDPVRFIGNRSSGRQGHAIAEALARAGADVVLVSGPVALDAPRGVRLVAVESARQMARAVEENLPADVAVCAAAVADWRPVNQVSNKLKKQADGEAAPIKLVENPDILANLSQHQNARPKLVIGFAAETDNVLENAQAKLGRKQCDWLLANHVGEGSRVFGGDRNQVTLLRQDGHEAWPNLSKRDVAKRLVSAIAGALG